MAKRYGVDALFPGWVGRPEIWTLMRRCDIGLLPYGKGTNYIGGMPNKAAEYLSAGLPVVSSLEGPFAKLLSEYRSGATYGCGNDLGLTEILRTLYDDRASVISLRDGALRLFEAKFTAERVYGEMAEYLERFVAYRQCGSTLT
jgi:glycosyltransferase involved in cell wall biosynthesis